MKKKLMTIFLISMMSLSIIGCGSSVGEKSANSSKTVRMGFPGTQNFLGGAAGIAQEKKYIDDEFQKIGYTVEYKPFASAGPAVNEALASKEIDIAIYADFPGILSKSRGIETSLIGIADNYVNSAILVNLDSNITSVKDLKGKKIGFIKGTYMQKYLYQILESNGIKQSDVELINTTDGNSALQGGTIDALVTTDTEEGIQVLTKKLARTLDTSKDHPEISAQSIVIGSTKYLNENREVGIALQKALLRGKEFMISNTDEAYGLLTKSGIDKETSKILYGKDNGKFEYVLLDINEESKKKLNESKKFMLDNKLISKDFDINEWIDTSFYQEANKN